MNWGTSIVIGMAIAMTAIVSAGIYMVSHDTDSLEESDYYENGLNYDQDYNQKEQAVQAHAVPVVSLLNDSLKIRFQSAGNKGQVFLKRPSDKSMDMTLPFDITKNEYQIPLGALKNGAWHIRINWKNNKKDYLFEEELYVP
ncbi:FixH family protein [Olivibacter sitiensis]|uniref:FixH family protein n=1 Tax=Olivibacter sitiensis TaxID=376470 RepID=UPI0003F9DB3C|nr:FixH family protein [Olivibacter sitiensis]